MTPPFIQTAREPTANQTPNNKNKSYMVAAIRFRGKTIYDLLDILV